MQVLLEAETSSVLFAEWGFFGSCVENVRFWHKQRVSNTSLFDTPMKVFHKR